MGLNSTRRVTIAIDEYGQPTDTFGGRVISGEWNGGAYVDLFFGGFTAPAESINVYDYATGTCDHRVHTPNGLRSIIREWAADTAAEWPDYYAAYVANSNLFEALDAGLVGVREGAWQRVSDHTND